MNNQDTIKKAVELADGWEYVSGTDTIKAPFGFRFYKPIPLCLDALAAQLKRQAMKLGYRFESVPGHLRVRETAEHDSQTIVTTHGEDDSMNIIEAYVRMSDAGCWNDS